LYIYIFRNRVFGQCSKDAPSHANIDESFANYFFITNDVHVMGYKKSISIKFRRSCDTSKLSPSWKLMQLLIELWICNYVSHGQMCIQKTALEKLWSIQKICLINIICYQRCITLKKCIFMVKNLVYNEIFFFINHAGFCSA